MEACLRALEAFISPSAATTSLASRVASASAAITLCMATGILTSLISTRATLIPHCSVALSRMPGLIKCGGWWPCLWQGAWSLMILEVPSNPRHSMILHLSRQLVTADH
uniref:Uncharacterized protein n=1 Tax=Coturnix japonica TaxID=93934 RepID=A0A8C2UDF4_COTJA